MKFFSIFYFLFILFGVIEGKSNLTLDSFFNYTSFRSLGLSSNGEHLLIHTKHPAWDLNSFQNSLWLYHTVEHRKKLITDQLYEGVKLQWSPSGKWVVFLVVNNSASNSFISQYFLKSNAIPEQNLYLYSVESDQTKSIPIGNDFPIAITWSNNDSSLYYATININSTDYSQWNDIIPYQVDPTCIIRQISIDIKNDIPLVTEDITSIPFLIGELLYSPTNDKLLFSTVTSTVEKANSFQIYSIDLKNISSIIQLTTDPSLKQNLQLTVDNKRVIFQTYPIGSSEESVNLTQQRLYSIELTSGQIQRWADDFQGNILSYTTKSDRGVYILGQLGINVQIYSQTSPNNVSVLHDGLNGSYQLISSSLSSPSIAFVFTSFSKAQEAYFITNIDQLKSAISLTNENNQYDQINLPEGQAYING